MRPAEYTGVEEWRTDSAKVIYTVLFLYHLMFSTIEMLVEWRYDKWVRSQWTILLVITVYLVIYLCQNWVYVPGRDLSALTPRQELFEQWLWVEVCLIYGKMASAILFTFFHALKPSTYLLQDDNSTDKG